MLQNTLYLIKSIQKLENNDLFSTISINKDDRIFEGHFPGQPVLPGVCLINMITDVVSNSKKKTYYLKSADTIKFLHLVEPSLFPTLIIQLRLISEISGIIKAEATISSESLVFLKFKGNFEKLQT